MLVLFKGLVDLLHRLFHLLLNLQHPLAFLRVGVGMQAFPDGRHAVFQLAQRIELNSRDLDVGRSVAWLHLQDVLEVADAPFHCAALKRTGCAQLPKRQRATRRQDGIVGLLDTFLPILRLSCCLREDGRTLGLLEGRELLHFPCMFVVFLCRIPIAKAGLQPTQLDVRTLESGLELKHLLKVVGCLRGAPQRKVRGRTFEEGEVVGGVPRNGSVVVDEGIASFSLRKVSLRGGEEARNWGIGGNIGSGKARH